MAVAQVLSTNNVPLPAAPPSYFIPNANGVSVPAGHTSWQLVFTTTGLPNGAPLCSMTVQYHYTGAMLNDGTGTLQPFTGWIDDCQSDLVTTYTNRLGQVVHQSFMGCTLNRIPNFYPDNARLNVTSCPGYASVPNVTLNLN